MKHEVVDMSKNVFPMFLALKCHSHNRRKRDIGDATGRNHEYIELPVDQVEQFAVFRQDSTKEYTALQQWRLFVCWCSVLSLCIVCF